MISTAELLQTIDIPRNKLYYLEQKGYISPQKKVVGEKEYRLYSAEDAQKISLIWRHLKRGLRYRVAYQLALEELRNPTLRFEDGLRGGKE